MLLFLLAGSVVAIKVILHLRKHGVDDEFSRVSCIIACLWMANVVAFIFLHGDSEYAMKTFSLQAGLLITCQYMLRDRLREEQPEQPELGMRILHLVGQREDAGGILSVIRCLHQAGPAADIRHTVWVHRDYAETRSPVARLPAHQLHRQRLTEPSCYFFYQRTCVFQPSQTASE